MIAITTDFETQSEANLKKTGAYEYAVHATTRVTCLALKAPDWPKAALFDWYQMEKPFLTFPEKFKGLWRLWIKSPSFVFSAHNAFFEKCIYKLVLVDRLGWPPIPDNKWRCTAAKAAVMAIPRNLADAGAVMALQVQKDFAGHHAMMKTCKPTKKWADWQKAKLKGKVVGEEPMKFWTPATAPEDFATLYRYCKIDAASEEELDSVLPDLTTDEQELWFLDQKINWRGINVDMPLVKKISAIMEKETKTMGRELDVLTMGLVESGNARKQILEFLMLEEIELPDLKAKTVDDFLKNGHLTGDARKLLEIRKALSKASTAKYKRFLECGASDGRVRDLFMYCGASTGRWTGKNLQPQNFPRGVIKDIDEAIYRIKTESVDTLKLLYGENLMPLFASVLRGMFIASPGHELFVEDLNAIETRVLWWLAGHKEGLAMFARGECPYKDQASSIFKKPVSAIEDDGNERQTGKAAVLGCGYQMGHKKFKTAAWDVYRAHVSEDLAKIAVTSYREKHYPVVELWENYQAAAIAAVENPAKRYRVGPVVFFMENSFLKIKLPSGRNLSYKDPRVNWETTHVLTNGDGEVVYASSLTMVEAYLQAGFKKSNTFESKKLKYWAVNMKAKKVDCVIPKWTREATYGGKIAENITQGVARDVLAHGLTCAEAAGFSVLMHSHDEGVSEAPIGTKNQKEYRQIFETPPPWADGLPLKSSGWVGPRYRKG